MNIDPDLTGVRDAGSLRQYRTEIPNLVLTMLAEGRIAPHDFALYAVYKRTAGDAGRCFKSTRTLANDAGMSLGQVAKSRANLTAAGLIDVEEVRRRGGRPEMHVTIRDVWAENMAAFGVDRSSPPELQSSQGEVRSSPGEQRSSHHEQRSSPGEPKKNPFKKNPLRKNQGGEAVRAAARTTRHAPTEGMGEGISEPNDAPTSKPSRPSKPARPAEPTPTRQRPRATPKPQAPQAPQAPEEREGPFREVFQAICRVRRQSPDILAEEDRANTRRLTSTLCRAGVEDRETVEGWGRGWYVDMATRTRRRASQVSAPTIAQLTTWFGGRIAERDGAHLTIETTTGADSGWMTN